MEQNRVILLFDGDCNLCSGVVQWVINNDKNANVKMTSLQSDAAIELNKTIPFPRDLNTIVLIVGNHFFVKSNAALELTKHIDNKWRFLSYLKVFPLRFRDFIYDFVAKNRYKWMGKRVSCWIPTPELRDRFLDLS